MEATIKISEEILPQVDSIVKEFGFETKEEFIQEAIRDKILEIRKKVFFEGTDKISENLRKQGISEKEILDDFNRFKHK
ncbi:MAG: ribbon-helix-helix domain-containing protein [Candidatus Woesearchaeota archaeon]